MIALTLFLILYSALWGPCVLADEQAPPEDVKPKEEPPPEAKVGDIVELFMGRGQVRGVREEDGMLEVWAMGWEMAGEQRPRFFVSRGAVKVVPTVYYKMPGESAFFRFHFLLAVCCLFRFFAARCLFVCLFVVMRPFSGLAECEKWCTEFTNLDGVLQSVVIRKSAVFLFFLL